MRMRQTSSSGLTTRMLGGQTFRAPCDRGITADTAFGRRIFLRHVLGVFVGSGRILEIGPGMGDHPIIARKLRGRRFFHRLPDFTGNLGGRAGALAVVRMFPDRIAGGNHRHFDPVAVLHPEGLARPRFIGRVLESQNRQQPVGLAGENFASLVRVRGINIARN